jgi:nucleoside-diphosphate-sugar epimerase
VKIVITGRKGFIGRHLVTLLKRQGHIIKEIEIDLDIIHHQVLEADAVVHLASKTELADFLGNPAEAYNINVGGIINVLDFCRKNNAKLIFTSTCGVYSPLSRSVKEIDRVVPVNSYSTSKYIGELLCARYQYDFDVSVTILRLFNVYGLYQRESFVISYIFNCICNNKPLNLKTPEALRDFVYIDDVCMAILKALERKNDELEIFNIGSGKIVSIGDVAEIIYRFWGKKIRDEVKTGLRGNYLCANLDSVKNHLEWEPKVSLEEGLRIMAIEYGKKR